MKLKRLEINGYKNLGAKTVFNFEHCSHYVALIGLNGSGKSNVLEAISLIIHSYYYKRPLTDFSFLLEYEKGGNLVRLENNEMFVDNNKKPRKRNIQDFLPTQVIACYSGEETRLWEDIFEHPYLKYFKKIKLNYDTEKLNFLYINKYSWRTALLTLLCHTGSDAFIKDLLGLSNPQDEIKISFEFAKNYQKRKGAFTKVATNTFTVPNLIDRIKKEQERYKGSLQISQVATIDLGSTLSDSQNDQWCRKFFEYMFLATMPKTKKLVENIRIEFNGRNVRTLSEGEKKVILIKCISVLALDDSLALLDEPDSHVHLERKKEVVEALKQNQHASIFTTHSPTLTKYCDKRNVFQIDNGEVSLANSVYEGIEHLIDEDDVLKTMFSSKDIILCEGKTDDIYVSKALEHFRADYPTLNFDFIRLGGSDPDNAKDIVNKLEVVKGKKVIIMVDRDDAGYKVYKGLFPLGAGKKNHKDRSKIDFEKYADNIFFLMLPHTDPSSSGDFMIEDYFGNDNIKQLAKDYIDASYSSNISFGGFPNLKQLLKTAILKKYCEGSSPEGMKDFKVLLDKLKEIMDK